MSAEGFRERTGEALSDTALRANLRRAMNGLMERRSAQFPDEAEWTALRAVGTAVRARALSQLPELLVRLEERCRLNGMQVHWAETAEEATETVLAILKLKGARRVVKGKSMVSEELHLNRALSAEGIESIETDLGEWIVQLAGEAPSHIIMPAVHMSRAQIARLFAEKVPGATPQPTGDVDELTALARRVLRKKFEEADAGISGVNFATADTGTLVLVENEGNGRMSTHVPPLHIALMGIEKVIERLEDVPALLTLLCRSATGQPITTYVNMISGPRGPGEKDGPHEVHLVLVDNGRSRIYADPGLGVTLRCIRCGACMNHCPVYTRIGGHAYAATVPGPIGQLLTPQLEGLATRHELPRASSLCGACDEVCPVEIPISELLVRLRSEDVQPGPRSRVEGAGSGRSWPEALLWKTWRRVHESPRSYRRATRLLARLGNIVPAWIGPLAAWTRVRSRPRVAPRSLHELVRERGLPDA